jgi:Tol biopolymer transport system component
MSLTAGTRLGPYEVVAPLGAGGMGEVYRARDTKLNRDVAIKVLPEAFAADADRLARFAREAQVLASLNHPNIAAIYGIEQNALVMELVEGEDLSTVIQGARRLQTSGSSSGSKDRGLHLTDALPIARQIADALEAAHEQGIVHRDLKPANIKVRPDGTVKVLDFGLAKALGPPGSEDPGLQGSAPADSPTLTARATQIGMIIGTAAYMAPEQAKGKAVDRRADIWAFGVVLYEMLSGRRAFDGEDISTTLAAVLTKEPEWAALPADMQPALNSLIRRCLERDPKVRLRDIGEARVLLSNPQTLSASLAASAPATVPERRSRAVWIALGVVGALWIATLVPALRYFRPAPEPARLQFDVPTTTVAGNQTLVALSPDGRLLAYVADLDYSGSAAVWIRALDGSGTRALPATVGATQVFWAPDSRRLAFAVPGKLQIIDVTGGGALEVCAIAGAVRGGTWNAAGEIVFARAASAFGSLLRVTDSGGTPVEIAKPDASRQESSLVFPEFLPDGRHFLYLSIGTDLERRAIYARSLDGGATTMPRMIVAADSMPVYASGRLLYVRGGRLFAHEFDAARLQLLGEPVQLADNVMGTGNVVGRFAFSASQTGLLAFRTGAAVATASDLTWVERDGKTGTTVGDSRQYNQFRLSPDEKRVVFSQPDPRGLGSSLWTIEMGTGVTSQLTVDVPVANNPVWSPDSETVAFEAAPKGPRQLYRQTIGSRSMTPVFESPDDPKWLDDWSRDGQFLLFHLPTPARLYSVPVKGGTPTLLTESKANLDSAHFSPDGKWIAYQTNETGAYEVWVAAFPGFNQRRQVSARGGGQPFWRGDSRELFYLTADGKMVSVAVMPDAASPGTLDFRAPEVLFQSPLPRPNLTVDQYAVTRDGRRFLFIVPRRDANAPVSSITVRVNWTSGLKK